MAVVQCAGHVAWLAAFYMEMAMLFGSSQTGTNGLSGCSDCNLASQDHLQHKVRLHRQHNTIHSHYVLSGDALVQNLKYSSLLNNIAAICCFTSFEIWPRFILSYTVISFEQLVLATVTQWLSFICKMCTKGLVTTLYDNLKPSVVDCSPSTSGKHVFKIRWAAFITASVMHASDC